MPPNVFDQFDETPSAPAAGNVFDQFDEQQPQQRQPYSLGPFSAAGRLLNRGIDYALGQAADVTGVEALRPVPRDYGPALPEANLPVIGAPSATGMAKGVAQQAVGAATLPGDVYAGRVDPLSEEGIRRAADLAMLTQLPSVPSVARRPAVGVPLASEKIVEQGSNMYNALRQEARQATLGSEPEAYAKAIAADVRKRLDAAEFSEIRARPIHNVIDEIEKIKTPTGLVDIRERLGKIGRESYGTERAAAFAARDIVNEELDALLPGASERLATADKNYAIGSRVAEVEQAMRNARTLAEASRYVPREGTQLRRQSLPFLKEEAKFVSPEVREAARRAARAGSFGRLAQSISVFDPSRGAIGMWGHGFSALANPAGIPWQLGAGIAGYGAGRLYDRLMRGRMGALSETIRGEAPASLAAGYVPGGLVPRAAPTITPTLALPVWQAEQNSRYR
jgi:hypothetical protein